MFDTGMSIEAASADAPWHDDASADALPVPRDPSPRTAAVLDAVILSTVDDQKLVDLIASWESLAAWTHARQADAIVEFARRRPPQPGEPPGAGGADRFASDELSAALRISVNAAAERIDAAVDIHRRLPATARAWHSGAIDLRRASSVVDAVRTLDDDVAARVDERVIERAADRTPAQFRALLHRAVTELDAGGFERRHRAARASRKVVLTAQTDGMASLWALLPASDAAHLYATLSALAESCDDARTLDQRRADALVDLAELRIDPSAKPEILVTVPATTLLGSSEQPGHIAGVGPVPASTARAMASDATWRRLLTEPRSGAALDVGRTTYRPSAALSSFIRARDAMCRFPSCRHPATRSDLDHTVPFPDGPTSTQNLAALCRRHHLLKHRRRWTVHNDNGVLTWRSPTRHRYRTEPEPIVEPGHGRPPPKA